MLMWHLRFLLDTLPLFSISIVVLRLSTLTSQEISRPNNLWHNVINTDQQLSFV